MAGLSLALALPTAAQIIPDATLPTNSIVPPNCTNCVITGGTTRGAVLFHSFREFSVPTGGVARFNNALSIESILARVTGRNPSTIDGQLRTNGRASLFLLNPNGIVFGPNARLALGGSFLATTANSFQFPDGSEFSATNPAPPPPLLTVNVPVGLQFGANPAPIAAQGLLGLAPSPTVPRKTLALVVGDLNLTGGAIQVGAGQVELGAVGGLSWVGVSPSAHGIALNYDGVANFQDIRLTNRAQVGVSGVGGGIAIAARNLTIQDGARLVSITTGSGAGGAIQVRATESVELSGTALSPTSDNPNTIIRSGIFTSTRDNNTSLNGAAGDITIAAPRLTISGGAQISSVTGGSGATGTITINAP